MSIDQIWDLGILFLLLVVSHNGERNAALEDGGVDCSDSRCVLFLLDCLSTARDTGFVGLYLVRRRVNSDNSQSH